MRVVLVLWNESEAADRALGLEARGYEVKVFSDPKANPQLLAKSLPDVVLIDLGRSPSHGRELGAWLRRRKATRHIPIVFVKGDRAKTDRVRSLLPDAVFTDWENVTQDLVRAIGTPPSHPIVPGAMDAYAGAPLVKKLGIRAGSIVALVDAPEGLIDAMLDLPDGAVVVSGIAGHPDIICLFVKDASALEELFPQATSAMAEGGELWIAWPKKRSGVRSDLSQTAVRAYGLVRGLVDYKIASIDATWSGLCFARRKVEHEGQL